MVSARLVGTAKRLPLDLGSEGAPWLQLRPAADALGWKVTDAGGLLGLCPDADTCIPVPAEAVRDSGGQQSVRLDPALQEALGIAVAADDHDAVVVTAPRDGGASAPAGGGLPDLGAITLPHARSGARQGLSGGEPGTALYVWASW